MTNERENFMRVVKSIARPEPLLSFCFLLLLVGSSPAQVPPLAEMPALVSADPVKVDPADPEIRKLLKERYNAAASELRLRYTAYHNGNRTFGPANEMFDSASRLMQAGADLYEKPGEKVTFLTDYVKFAEAARNVATADITVGREPAEGLVFQRATYQLRDAEVQLARATRAAGKAGGK